MVLSQSGELVTATAAAHAWFAELGHDGRAGPPVPAEISTAAALLRRTSAPGLTAPGSPVPAAPVPRLRVRTTAGRWVALHASWLDLAPGQPARIAVIIEPRHRPRSPPSSCRRMA